MKKLTIRRVIKRLHIPHKVLLKAIDNKSSERIEVNEDTNVNESAEPITNTDVAEEHADEKVQSKKTRKKNGKEGKDTPTEEISNS